MTLLDAIARQEGFLVPGSRAARNHNPGNLNYGDFAKRHGATHADDHGYAVFPDRETGFHALRDLLQNEPYRGKTIQEAIRIYCPPTGDPRGANDTSAYVAHVCEWTNLNPSDVIDAHVV